MKQQHRAAILHLVAEDLGSDPEVKTLALAVAEEVFFFVDCLERIAAALETANR